MENEVILIVSELLLGLALILVLLFNKNVLFNSEGNAENTSDQNIIEDD